MMRDCGSGEPFFSAPWPRDHALGGFLRDKEGAARVGVEDEIEIVRRHVDHALRGRDTRIVDQDVDGARLGLGVGDGRADAVGIGHVQPHHVGAAALRFDIGAQLLEPLDPAGGQHHLGARCRQHMRETRPRPLDAPVISATLPSRLIDKPMMRGPCEL